MLGDPGKFIISCDFPGMDVCHALADLDASINLIPLLIWKKLSLLELTPTRMTLELADRSITRPKGVAEDVFVKVRKFHFPTDFVVCDFEADPQVPLILGRSFLRTRRALIDEYKGELILWDGDERLIFHVDKQSQKYANESIKMINFIDVSCEDSFKEILRLKNFSSGSTTPLSDSRPNLTSFETSDSLLEEFADELALLDPFPPRNKDVDIEADLREVEWLLNHDPSIDFSPKSTIDPNPKRFTDEPVLVYLPQPGDDNYGKDDTIPLNEQIPPSFVITSTLPTIEPEDSLIMGDEHLSAFCVEEIIPIPSESKDECDNDESSHEEVTHGMSFITYLNPLINLDKEIISSKFNPIHNEDHDSTLRNDHFDTKFYLPESILNHDTLIVSSPRNDPLHHEFTGELIKIPPRIVRKHEEYISLMWLLCGNSSSQPSKNFHASPNTIIESLPTFPIPIKDSDSLREKIDIFPGPDDLIPPNIERDDYTSSDDDSFEDIKYVEAATPDSELVSLEEVNDVDQEEEEINLENILQIQDVILREKLLNINRLIANIKYLNDNSTPDYVLKSPSSFPIPVTDSDSFFEESYTFSLIRIILYQNMSLFTIIWKR
ncbi:reverse transcriptase domain-containing protein [Tanacetum coccineum]